MTQVLRQSTAEDVLIGPFVDSGDGYTAETGVSPAVKLSKNGEALAAKNDVTTPVHDADGYYNCELDDTDTGTVGTLVLSVVGSAVSLPVRHEYQVLDTVTYDAIYGSVPTMLTAKDVGQLYESTIGTVTGQTEFICDVSIISDDNWIGNLVTIEDISTGETVSRWITDVVQSTDTIHINAAPPFTVVATDVIRVQSQVNASYAVENYDGPTRAESTSDTNDILAKLLAYVRLLTRSDGFVDIDDAAELTEINADGGSGAGNYDPETKSLEAAATAAEISSKIATDMQATPGNYPVDTQEINGTPVLGAGVTANKWRGS
jgi:hypothetical protein